MTPDPVRTLAEIPEVAQSAQGARDAIDQLLWDRAARARGRALATESTLLGAWASAAFEGAEVPSEALRSGQVEDSPIGLTAARTLAMYAEAPAASDLLLTAPLQVFARLHSLVSVGFGADDQVGRPRSDDEPADPLRLRVGAPFATVAERLQGVGRLLTEPTEAPAVVIAGLVHGELATILPFAIGSGPVARVMTRLVLRARGVDPDGWSIPEAGLRTLGRPRYVAALRGYAAGEPESVARWLVVHNEAVGVGAQAAAELVPELPQDND